MDWEAIGIGRGVRGGPCGSDAWPFGYSAPAKRPNDQCDDPTYVAESVLSAAHTGVESDGFSSIMQRARRGGEFPTWGAQLVFASQADGRQLVAVRLNLPSARADWA